LPIGIQRSSNTKELFSTAEELGVTYALLEDCTLDNDQFISQLNGFVSQHDHIYISIDLDGFAAAYAPGVSAPASVGLDSQFVIKTLRRIFNSSKVVSLDIAEMNPQFDRDGVTARLAARLVDEVVRCL